MERDREQKLLGFGARNASEGADFRVRQLAARHSRGNARQTLQRTRDANFLTCGAEIDPAFPIQPVSTGLRSRVRPAVAPIELGDEHQKAVVRRIQMPGKLGDLRLEGRGGLRSSFHGRLRSRNNGAAISLRIVATTTCISAANMQKCTIRAIARRTAGAEFCRASARAPTNGGRQGRR